mgnify:CR=1 FL=1
MASKKKAPAPKRGASRYQAPAKKPVPIWVWLGCFLLVGGFVVLVMGATAALPPHMVRLLRESGQSEAWAITVPQALPAIPNPRP